MLFRVALDRRNRKETPKVLQIQNRSPHVISGKNRLELGASAARSSGALAKVLVRLLSAWARRRPGALEAVVADARRHSRYLSRVSPGSLLELEGLARGLSMSPDDILCARVLAESLAVPGCTNFGARGPATSDGTTMLSWNFDASPVLGVVMGRFPLYVRDLAGTNPYVCLGVPALFGIGILNAEGLSCIVNAVGITDDGEGFTPFELNNTAMETCSTVAGAEEVFSQGPRQATRAMAIGMLMNWNMIWADLAGEMSLFEYSHSHFNRQPAADDGLLASANHHQYLDRTLTGSFDPLGDPMLAGSYSRLARMWALLRRYHGEISPEVAKMIISDHVPDYSILKAYGIEREWWEEKVDDSTVCAHAWNFWKHVLKGEVATAFLEWCFSTTLYSMQVQPSKMTVWFTKGFPCRNLTTPVYWGDMLGTSVERYPGAIDAPGMRARTVREPRGIFREGASPTESVLRRIWTTVVEKAEDINFR